MASLSGQIASLERMGTETVVKLNLDQGGSVLSVVPGDHELQIGAALTFGFRPEDAKLFPASDLPKEQSKH